MIMFWLLCAGLIGIAMAFVLPPLLQRDDKGVDTGEDGRKEANLAVYRDQLSELARDKENGLVNEEQFNQDRDELERRLLEDVAAPEGGSPATSHADANRNAVFAIAVAIPLIAVAVYFKIGNPNAMSATPNPTRRASSPMETPPAGPAEGERSQEQIEANVAALAKRTQENPGDLQGLLMLGRSYMSMEKYSEASAAYAKAVALKKDDPDLLADYAVALAMSNGQKLEGQPTELINRALKLDPENAKALELAGSAAFQAKDYKLALEHWEKLMRKVPTGSEIARELSKRIDETKQLAGSAK